MNAHPFDLETPEQRAARIIAEADRLEWEFRRQSAVELVDLAEADTEPLPALEEDDTRPFRVFRRVG